MQRPWGDSMSGLARLASEDQQAGLCDWKGASEKSRTFFVVVITGGSWHLVGRSQGSC